jgi:hypothetical protein
MSKILQIFIDVGFLKYYYEECAKPFDSINKKNELVFIGELIRRHNVYLNINDEILNNLRMNIHVPENILCLDSQSYIKIFFNSRHHIVKSCFNQCNSLLTEPDNIQKEEIIPTFYLTDLNLSESKILQKKTGIISINKDLEFHESFHRVFIKQIKHRRKYSLEEFTEFLPKANSIIIEDPYFYNTKHDFILEFINQLIKCDKDPIVPVRILIVITEIKQEEIEKITKQNLFKEICIKLNTEHSKRIFIEVRHSNKMHDRNVFSNNFWFSCGHSFNDSYNTDTEWLYRPIAIYFLEYIQRIQFATEFIFKNSFHCKNLLYRKVYRAQ